MPNKHSTVVSNCIDHLGSATIYFTLIQKHKSEHTFNMKSYSYTKTLHCTKVFCEHYMVMTYLGLSYIYLK